MPVSAPRPCSYAGCGVLVHGGSRCDKHKHVERKELDQRRGSAASRGYGSKWQKAREGFLRSHPLCEHCILADKITAALVVDHKVPHKGDKTQFWDRDNWQSLCKPCHDRKTASQDGGFGR